MIWLVNQSVSQSVRKIRLMLREAAESGSCPLMHLLNYQAWIAVVHYAVLDWLEIVIGVSFDTRVRHEREEYVQPNLELIWTHLVKSHRVRVHDSSRLLS